MVTECGCALCQAARNDEGPAPMEPLTLGEMLDSLRDCLSGRPVASRDGKVPACQFFDDIVGQSRENFHAYGVFKYKVEGQEVEFHNVGRNSSHEFAVGMLGEKLVTYAAADDCWCDGVCECVDRFSESISIRGERVKPGAYYLGHW